MKLCTVEHLSFTR